jgi:hypothetical protein
VRTCTCERDDCKHCRAYYDGIERNERLFGSNKKVNDFLFELPPPNRAARRAEAARRRRAS